MRFNTLIMIRSTYSLITMFALTSLGARTANAGSCCGSGGASSSCSPSGCGEGCGSCERPRQASFVPPHGGQLTKTLWNYVEVVHGAHETRVYLFDSFRFPQRVARVQGHLTLLVRSAGREFSYPLRAVPVARGQDYLAAKVDLTHVAPGDMDVNVNLEQVPGSADPVTKVTQVFAGTAPPAGNMATRQVALSTTLGALPEQGRSCCQSGEGNESFAKSSTVFRPTGAAENAVQSEGIDTVRLLPPVDDERVSRGAPTLPNLSHEVTAASITPSDDVAIQRQRVCPVTGQLLGSHGRPTKVLIDGQALYLCCAGCLAEVQRQPAMFIAATVSR